MFALNKLSKSLAASAVLSICLSAPSFAAPTDKEIGAIVSQFSQQFESGQIKPSIDISETYLLNLLNLDLPALSQVKQLSERGQTKEAMTALLAHFRAKYQSHKLGTEGFELDKYTREHAKLALDHIIKGNTNYEPVFRGKHIQWTEFAVIDGKTITDKEFLFQYHRLRWWQLMGKAYQETGDEAYFHEWRYQMVTYMNELLPITEKSHWFVRRGMEAYFRTLSAYEAFSYFVHSPNFDENTLQHFLAFFYTQAEHIRTVYAGGGNHLLGELIQVFKNGAEFPEFKKSEEWITEAVERVPALLDEQIYQDGMNKEAIFSYHTMYARLFHGFYQALENANMLDRAPAHFAERVKQMHDLSMTSMHPDGSTPQFGDAWKYRKQDGVYIPRYADWIYKTWSERFPSEPHYQYLATEGKTGQAWSETNFNYPVSGFSFFRSDWSKDAVYLGVEFSNSTAWHAQPDTGTFELSAYGQHFMIDSGAYIYGSHDPEETRLRDWFRSSVNHQTVTLNNENVNQKAEQKLWHNSDSLSVVVFDNQSYDNFTHRRNVLWLNNEFVVIHDEISGEAEGTVRAHFQLTPNQPAFSEDGYTVTTGFEQGANLLFKTFPQKQGFFSSLFGSNEVKLEQQEGWISYVMNHKYQRPAWAYAIEKSAGDNVEYLTALYPQKGKVAPELAENVQVSVEHNNGVNQYTITTDKGEFRINVDIENQKVIQL